MAVSSIGPTCAQTKPPSMVNISDRLCTVRHLITAAEMMAADLDDTDQKSAFFRVFETLKGDVRDIETDLDAIRAGEAS